MPFIDEGLGEGLAEHKPILMPTADMIDVDSPIGTASQDTSLSVLVDVLPSPPSTLPHAKRKRRNDDDTASGAKLVRTFQNRWCSLTK